MSSRRTQRRSSVSGQAPPAGSLHMRRKRNTGCDLFSCCCCVSCVVGVMLALGTTVMFLLGVNDQVLESRVLPVLESTFNTMHSFDYRSVDPLIYLMASFTVVLAALGLLLCCFPDDAHGNERFPAPKYVTTAKPAPHAQTSEKARRDGGKARRSSLKKPAVQSPRAVSKRKTTTAPSRQSQGGRTRVHTPAAPRSGSSGPVAVPNRSLSSKQRQVKRRSAAKSGSASSDASLRTTLSQWLVRPSDKDGDLSVTSDVPCVTSGSSFPSLAGLSDLIPEVAPIHGSGLHSSGLFSTAAGRSEGPNWLDTDTDAHSSSVLAYQGQQFQQFRSTEPTAAAVAPARAVTQSRPTTTVRSRETKRRSSSIKKAASSSRQAHTSTTPQTKRSSTRPTSPDIIDLSHGSPPSSAKPQKTTQEGGFLSFLASLVLCPMRWSYMLVSLALKLIILVGSLAVIVSIGFLAYKHLEPYVDLSEHVMG